MFKIVKPIFLDGHPGKLCCKPYPNHKHGCPNYNYKDGCPPDTKRLDEILNFSLPIFVIWNIFDFKFHTDKMSLLHPDWSKRQIECCLYWQSKARKQLKIMIEKFIFFPSHKNYFIEKCPEAYGINVTRTMAQIGENLEWPPMKRTYQVAIAGKKKQ